jgi:hypothetical protein
LWFVCGATLYVVAAGAHTQAPAEPTARAVSCAEEDGCLLSSEPLTLTKPYAQLDDLSKFRFPQAEYDEAKEPARLRVPENHLPQRGSAHRRLYLQAEADDGTEAAGDHLQSRRDGRLQRDRAGGARHVLLLGKKKDSLCSHPTTAAAAGAKASTSRAAVMLTTS